MLEFKTKDEGTWFHPIKGGPDGVLLRKPTIDEYDSIKVLTKQSTDVDYHRGQRYETERVDIELSAKLSLRKFIMDWKGISLDGVELECNYDNIEKMMLITDFRTFIGESIEKLVDENKTIEAARAKNLKGSLDGGSAEEEKSAETTV